MIKADLINFWNSLSIVKQRVILGFIFFSDSYLGLTYGRGSLNFIDLILGGNLPSDFVWLLQTFQMICIGFYFVKILFENVPPSRTRTAIMCMSPFLLILHVLFSLNVLLSGQGLVANLSFNIGTIGISTLTWSSTYLAIAVGCTLTYSVQRYGNFAQSEFFMLGMYVGIAFMWTDWLFPISEAPADDTLVWSLFAYVVVGSFVLTGIAGIIIDRLVFKGFRDSKSSPDVMMIASLGVAMILRSLVYLRFGSNTKRLVPDKDWMSGEQRWEIPSYIVKLNLGNLSWPVIDSGTTNYPYDNAFLPIIIFISVFLLVLLLNYTRLGRRMRAVADNPELAASSGINVERVQMTSAFLSAGISGLGGAVFGLTVLFTPKTAFTLLLPAFAVIVLGTIGSVRGAIVASIIIGFVRAISEPVLSGIGNPLERTNYYALAGVTPYAIIIAILLIMPEGIGKAYQEWNIERIRRRASNKVKIDNKRSSILGVLFGWAGAHQIDQGRSSRGVTMLVLSVSSFVLGKSLSFISDNSFAGKAIVQPPEGLNPSMHADWMSVVEREQTVIELLDIFGDILWPWVPILIWLFAIYESYLIYNNNYIDLLHKPRSVIIDYVDSINLQMSSALVSIQNKFTVTSGGNKYVDKINYTASKYNSFISESSSAINDKLGLISSNFFNYIGAEHGRESENGSRVMFAAILLFLIYIVYWLPSITDFTKLLQVSGFLVTLSIFLLLAFSLNIHTGMTGLVNFGVIFFVAVGAIIVGVLTAPSDKFGYDWDIVPAVTVAVIFGGIFGWLLAYPTARLRTDYFAIITISLGEIVRILLMGEPLLRTGANVSAVGVQNYPLPLQKWWFCGDEAPVSSQGTEYSPSACASNGVLVPDSPARKAAEYFEMIGLDLDGKAVPYMFLLSVITLSSALIVWWFLNILFNSPWGRILRSIREDEEVAQHHGHDVFTHKARSLALGGAIAALAGAFWAWKLTGFQPSFMSPAKSTFLVWAAFIIGGAGNNRGMLIGAMIITLTEFLFNVLVAAQSSPDLALGDTAKAIDENFVWIVESPLEIASYFLLFSFVLYLFRRYGASETLFWFSFIFMICHLMFDQRSIDEVFPEVLGGIQVQMTYVKLMLIGLLIMVSLKYNPKGLLPEVPYRPERPVVAASFPEDQAIAAIPDYDESDNEEGNTGDE
tara:strand:+ start:1348 stop:4869 length:3522 start_codon:yes stop_codon:yes gene_type:complete